MSPTLLLASLLVLQQEEPRRDALVLSVDQALERAVERSPEVDAARSRAGAAELRLDNQAPGPAAARAEAVILTVPGAADVKVTAASAVKELRVALDRDAMSRLGLSSDDVGRQVELALGSAVVTQVVDGPRRIDVVVRVPDGNRLDPASFGQLPVSVEAGVVVPLSAVASLEVIETPEASAHEGGARLVVVGANIRGRDVGGFVRDASAELEARAPLPEGYRYEWGGQYRHQQTALRRLAILVPLSIGAIYLLLYLAFGSFLQGALIMTNVPFALAGGVAALWLRGRNFSTSAIIGFIASSESPCTTVSSW